MRRPTRSRSFYHEHRQRRCISMATQTGTDANHAEWETRASHGSLNNLTRRQGNSIIEVWVDYRLFYCQYGTLFGTSVAFFGGPRAGSAALFAATTTRSTGYSASLH